MDTLIQTYWPVILVALLVGIVAGYLIFRPKQRVTLSDDSAPRRPHMAGIEDARSKEGRGLVDEAAAGLTDVSGQFMQAEVHEHLPGATGEPDDLKRLKGVGPKLATALNGLGIVRFDQIAKLTPAQLAKIDEHLGSFKGRLARDRVVEQADYLARGDIDGYEARFGKL
ncbi:hypothetical protein [Sphingomicrobium astaxanthinifaciens]|uniref:hypothetical protein n=1 Tax=Sphingomicrobium astaxanthinifaciens TaxID=1227949 RepID=UPI001FCC9874|nr:hypothetical protein [Sphingomicrobium astaxanthinifaciens]MCJ7421395.1 hypothetical protein [Sphingomicrobium astaxanthinifaciens]